MDLESWDIFNTVETGVPELLVLKQTLAPPTGSGSMGLSNVACNTTYGLLARGKRLDRGGAREREEKEVVVLAITRVELI